MPVIILIIIALLFSTVYIFFAYAPQIGGRASGKRLARIKASSGFKDGQFRNVIETSLNMPFRTILRTLYEVLKGSRDLMPSTTIKTIEFDADKFYNMGNAAEAVICWFGHSSLLLKLHGKVFLIDPMLVGKRASMLS